MSKLVRIVLGVILGYAAGVAVGAAAIQLFSGNTHDKSLEMAMTAIFATGPIGAILGLIGGVLWKRQSVPDVHMPHEGK